MVNVSQDIIKSFNEGNQQTALIEVTAGSKTFTITEADIIQGGLKIDRYCVTNSKIEVGSAVASELSLKLRNYDGRFNDVSFEGAVLNVKIGIKLSSVLEGATLGKGILGRMILGSASSDQDVAYVPCGLFIVDTPPRKLSTISISALDYMVLFDREVNASALSFPIHVDALIQKICSICNVTLATDVSVLPNHYFSIGGLPDTNQKLTYRQLLQWCAQLTGTCAFMDGSGRLVLKWYEQTGVTITASERYSSDMLENDIAITGFTCDDGKGNTYLSGTADYTLDLSDCGFLTNAYDGVLKELQAARGGFAYRPYSATIKSAPYLFPLDMIRYKDKDGVVHDTIVTNVTLALNCNTAISGSGETVTSSSYAQSASGVTSQQAATDRANLEKINQANTQASQAKQDVTEAAKTATNFLEYTPQNGLIIRHESLPDKKVQITNDGIRVTYGSSMVNIQSGSISITDGNGSCTITSGNITFKGIRNKQELWYNSELTFAAQTIKPSGLSNYSALLILFRSQKEGTWLAGGGNAGLVSMIVPVNGVEMSMVYPWNTVHKRSVTVYTDRIVFGNGYERTSDYTTGVLGTATFFSLQSPSSDGWSKSNGMCVPYKIYGFM